MKGPQPKIKVGKLVLHSTVRAAKLIGCHRDTLARETEAPHLFSQKWAGHGTRYYHLATLGEWVDNNPSSRLSRLRDKGRWIALKPSGHSADTKVTHTPGNPAERV